MNSEINFPLIVIIYYKLIFKVAMKKKKKTDTYFGSFVDNDLFLLNKICSNILQNIQWLYKTPAKGTLLCE